jgi:undecaprenyl-diphosphatase
MSRKLFLFISAIVVFVIFIGFSYLVHKNHFTHFDFDMTVRLQDHMPRRFDGIFSDFSILGNAEVMSVLLAIVVIMLFIRKKFMAGISAVALFVGFHLIEIYGKTFVSHPPPPQFLLRTQYPFQFPEFTVRLESSYPSGHSGRTLLLSTILIVWIVSTKKFSLLTKSILCGAIVLFDIIMLISRVYLGEHWSSDVIGGTMLGMAFGLFTSIFVQSKIKKTKPKVIKEE